MDQDRGASGDPAPYRGLVELDEHACFLLLAAEHLGRIAVNAGALPAVFPVHYALLGRDPVFRTDAGAKLTAASAGNIVCLEVDASDALDHTGWSVMVTGPAEVLVSDEDLGAARLLPLQQWVGRGDFYVRVQSALVTGRRVSHRAMVRGPRAAR